MRCILQIFLLYYLIIPIRLFSEQNFDFEVPEDIPVNTVVGKIILEPNVNYRLNGHNQFALVNTETGEIRITKPLDRETITSNGTIILILTAEPNTIIAIRIKVLDINDNNPTFPSKYMNVSIVESAIIGSRIRLQPAYDPDLAENGTIVNYELKDGEFFRLVRSSNSTGDVLLLELLAKLDRETKDLYILKISAYDGGNPPRSGFCIVYVHVLDANDNAPKFRQSRYDVRLNRSMLSDTATLVLQVEATDADADDNSFIGYRLTTNPSEYFQIDNITGAITIRNKAVNCSINDCLQDCSEICVLTVEAEDHGEPKLIGRTLVYIHLTDTNMYDPELNFRIYPAGSEFASISSETSIGSTIAVITANDRDDGQNIQISIIDGNSENYFRLETGKNYGILRQNRLLDKPIEQFLLKFSATDDGIPKRSSKRDLTVFVKKLNDTAPELEEKFIKVDILETSPVGSFIAAIRAYAMKDLTFSIIENSKNEELFLVGKNTGIVTLSKAWPNHTKWNYEFEVIIRKAVPSDKFSICTIQLSIIDVNNHEPEFPQPFYKIEVLEDTPPLTVIFKISATDKDHGNNSVISYSIKGQSFNEQIFMIKESSGEILLRKTLDREIRRQHKIIVTATDHGNPSRSSSTLLIINILDVNDNDPYFGQVEYHGYIVRGDPPGTRLVQLKAFDDDSPKFAQISYLFYHSMPSFLDLDHKTGQIHLAIHADLLNFKRVMEIVVGAKDNGGRLSRNNATVHLWLLDSIHQVPKFSTANKWSLEISENSSPDKILATFSVQQSFESIRYRINTTDLLINEFTGQLRARRSFDREVEPRIDFTVYADGKWSTAIHQGTLNILDQNDNSPIFELDNEETYFIIDTRRIGIGTELFRIRCYDPDNGPNGQITYNANSSFFGINQETGIVQLLKFPNGFNQLQFYVTATDHGEQSRHSIIKVIVEIKENEKIHSFSPVIALSIPENIPLGTIITNLAPKNITERFEFQTSRTMRNLPIQILPSGEVFVASMIDYEVINYLSIPVTAFSSDKNSVPNKHEFLLQLYIEDLNDNAPQCPSNNKFLIAENNNPGTIVGYFNGIDNDSGSNGILLYELIDDSRKIFSIDPNTGTIRALLELDFELAQFYNLTIIVTDGGLLKTNCTVIIKVEDLNDNIPQWEQGFYHFHISSNLKDNLIGRVIARDLDSGLNGEIRYKLKQKWMPFKISESTGDIIKGDTFLPGHIYNITVIATDHGTPSLSNETFVFIHSDANEDCLPHFINYPKNDIEIDDSLLGQLITQVNAVTCGTDEILYSLSYGYSSHRTQNLRLFSINSGDGSIFLTKSLHEYVGQRIELIINAEVKPFFTNITFGVTVVEKRNGNSGTDTMVLHIQENNIAGVICGKIEIFGRRHLHLLRQIPAGTTFRLQNGNLICDEVLDYEEVNFYRLVIAASDNLKPIIITIQVDDENDNSPECFGTRAVLIASESTFVPFNCQDKDGDLNGAVGYEIIQNDKIISSMNTTGFIVNTFIGDPKYFSVLVYDRSTNNGFREDDQLRRTTELHYILIASNPRLEAPIEFRKQYRLSRNIQPGTIFGTVLAKTGTTIEYFTTSFKNEKYLNSQQWADINRQTGQLYINGKPNDSLIYMEITLLSEGFTKTITIELFVIGKESNIDNIHSYYEFTIKEGLPSGSTVGRIGNGENLKFKLLNDANNFEIDKENGLIRTKNKIQNLETYLDIKVTSKDHDDISKLVTVFIVVVEAQKSSHLCSRSPIQLMVSENSPSGTFVGILTADDSNYIRYTLHGHPDALSIESDTGIISTNTPFDFEKENLYQFKVIAHEIQGTSIECDVFLHIIDKNDNAPKFSSSNYEVKVREDAPVGEVILQLEVEDLDTVNEFIYEISVLGNERNWFGIKPDGRIFLRAPLDRELRGIHHLQITVYDQRPPKKSFKAVTTVKIIVLDVNDNAPKFISPTVLYIFEKTQSGTIIGLVQALDPDLGHNGQLQYRILPWSNPNGLFMINPIHGYLMAHDQIDVDEQKNYHLLVEAKDYGTPKRQSTIVPITITILDKSTKLSRLRNFYHLKIPENVPIGHTVFQITEIIGNDLFEIESGNEDNNFRLSSKNGTIWTNKRLNAAKKSSYNLTISMQSNNNTRKQISIILIEILNIDAVKTSRFPGHVDRIVYVGENIQGPYPVTIAVLKLDVNRTLSYSLLQGNSTLFRVTPETGKLQITESLDYEVQNRYELIVQANDLIVPRSFSTISTITVLVMNVNDNAPIFEQPQYYVEVLENEPVKENSSILCLKATDDDEDDDREFSMIRYSLDDEDLVPFFINATTGCIGRLEVLDRESQSQWFLKVMAHDNGKLIGRSSTAIVQIQVLDQNDNIPIILSEQLDVFIPKTIEKDDVVYVLSAYDPDENDDILKYTLGGADVSFFQISQSGIITAKQKLLKKDYSVTAIVSDHGNLNTSVGLAFYVSETISFPVFEKHSQEFTVTEHDPDILVTKFFAQSANVSSRGIVFSIISGDLSHHFYLNPNSGQLYTTGRVDYEYRKQYELWIAAIDQHAQPIVSYANCIVNVVDINDNRPVFEKVFYSASVAENGNNDELIIKVTARDSDSGRNGKISYSLLAADDNDASKYFKINEESGEIFAISDLDAEHFRKYNLYVIAKDHGNPELSGMVVVKIDVLDENDNAPRFSNLFHGTVTENSPVGTLILQVTSYDADINGTLIYGLEGDYADNFLIDQRTGWISLAKEIDREKKSEYMIKAKAWDGLWEVRTSLTITVEDVNDNAPIFNNSFYKFLISINSEIFTEIGQLLAIDIDEGLNGQVSYDLRCGNDLFMIEPFSGRIFSITTLEQYMNNTVVECKGFASDHGFPSMISNVTVYIHIVDFNESNERKQSYYEFALLPNISRDITIGHLPMPNIIAVVNDSRFTMDQNGHLFTNDTFSESFPGQKIILSVVTDNQNDPFTKAIVSIEFTEPNTHRPRFTFKRYNFSIHENCPLKSLVGMVMAKDPDIGLNGRLTYHISYNAADRLPFTVEPTTGSIKTTGHLDYEEISGYHFSITVTDSGFPALNDTAKVTVEVLDENDNVPEFENHYMQYMISSNSPTGTIIAHLSAVDIDSEPNAVIVYHLVSDSAEELPFAINATSGTLYVSSQFPYESTREYSFHVLASNPRNATSRQAELIFERSRNETYSNLLQVEIFAKQDNSESELYFPETERNFDISASAFKGTIIGKVKAIYQDGNSDQILYRMTSSDLVNINGHTGEIYVKNDWNGSTGIIIVEIVATGQHSRNTNFKRNICKVIIDRKTAEVPPILESNYKFSLSEDSDRSKHFVIIKHFPPKYHLEIVKDGNGYDPEQDLFCIADRGKLYLCGPINYKQMTDYRLQIALLENDVIRSRALVTITVQNVGVNEVLLDPAASIGYILENSPINTEIMKLHIMENGILEKQPSFNYEITDNDLSKIFAINSTTGVVSSLQVLDRENRSLYIVPITISNLNFSSVHATVHLRIYVDDQNDNPPQSITRTIILSNLYEIPDMIILHTFPVDADQVAVYNCRLLNISETYNISNNCKLKIPGNLLESHTFLNTTLLVEASNRHENVKFPINLRIQRDTTAARSLLNDFGVFVELCGTERGIADTVSAFQDTFPDLVLQLLGLQHLELDQYRIFVTVLDQSMKPKNKTNALKLLKKFFAEKLIPKNVHVKQIGLDMYHLTPKLCTCRGAKCYQNTTKTGELFELIGYKTSFIVPIVNSQANCICANGILCEENENQICNGNKRCQNGGTCQSNTGTCLCTKGYSGKFCENDIDECEDMNVCANRKCLNLFGSFICKCDDPIHCNNFNNNICNRCQRGTCIKQNESQRLCKCDDGYSGSYCQFKIRCFDGFSSSMQFPIHQQIFMLTQEFRTTNPSSLLLSSFGTTESKEPHFTLALRDGQVYLSWISSQKKIELLVEEKVNDGKWKLIRFRYKHQRLKLTVQHCDDDGFCLPCKNSHCIATANNFKVPRITQEQIAYIGGVKNSVNSETISVDITKQVYQADIVNFSGCMRRIVINGNEINKVYGFMEQNIIDNDKWKTCTDGDNYDLCSGGICVTDQNDRKCICADGFDALNCHQAMEPWHVKSGKIIFQLSMYMMEKIKFATRNTSVVQKLPENDASSIMDDSRKEQLREISCEESEIEGDLFADIPAQWMELDFKTALRNTIIFSIIEEMGFSKIKLINGSAHIIAKMQGAQLIDVKIASNLDDSEWHRLSIQISEDRKFFRVEIDGHGKEIRSDEQLPTLISSSLLSLSLGHDDTTDLTTTFSGCFRRFIVNNQAQNFDILERNLLSQQIFKSIKQNGAYKGCEKFQMKQTSISPEWKIFWTLISIVLFFITLFPVVLWILRKYFFADKIAVKQDNCLKPKFSRLFMAVRSHSKTKYIDNNNMTVQRAMYCGPNVLQNNENEVDLCDSYATFQLKNPWIDDVNDLNASTLHIATSKDTVIYQNLKLLPDNDQSNTAESMRIGLLNSKQLKLGLRENDAFNLQHRHLSSKFSISELNRQRRQCQRNTTKDSSQEKNGQPQSSDHRDITYNNLFAHKFTSVYN